VEPIVVSSAVVVLAWAITMRAVRASGPGGQNVNKVSSKVELHVDLHGVVGLDGDARRRLATLASSSLDADGRLLVVSQLTRDQHRNIDDARDKVRTLITRALERPKPRRKTRPSRASVERRLTEKHHRTHTKSNRRPRDD
jgi:ribosome-associated protein